MTVLPDADGVFRERRTARVDAPAAVTWSCVADLGGEPGWYAVNRLWALRGRIDSVLGGPGLRGRPARELRPGDPVDGWRVESVRPGRALVLVSEHVLPGWARLEHEVQPAGTGSLLVQRLAWHPRGRVGRLFWRLELLLHAVVMRAMVRGMAREAARRGRGATPSTESVWDYPRPPAVDRSGGEVVIVTLGGRVAARTDRAIRVLETSHPPTYYLPRSAFAHGVLVPAQDPRRTVCEFKGAATYWDLVEGTTRLPRAAWSYEDPVPAYAPLRDHVAVMPGTVEDAVLPGDGCTVDGERVVPQAGGFYGGWATSRVTGPFKGEPGTLGW